jgi:hypothetical protein
MKTNIRFKNNEIFGNSFDAHEIKIYGHIMRLLLHDKIAKDGTISAAASSKAKPNKSELWSYIYILYMFNKDNSVFKTMRSLKKANAKHFIKTILEYTDSTHSIQITSDILIKFINKVIADIHPNNPILQFLSCRKSASTYTPIRSSANSSAHSSINDSPFLPIPPAILSSHSSRSSSAALSASSDSAAKSKACVARLRIRIRNILNTLILTKMCLIKYISDVLDLPNITPCDSMENADNHKKRKEAFLKLTATGQKAYKEKFIKSRDDILFYKDVFISIDLKDTTCEDQERQVETYIKELVKTLEEFNHIVN